MSTNLYSFTDIKASHFQKRMQQAAPAAQSESIISDLCDGLLVAELMLGLAGYSYTSTGFVLGIMGAIGSGEESVQFYDKEAANLLNCSDRTVRRGRKDYITDSSARNFWPVVVREGEYLPEKQEFARTEYTLNRSFASAIETAVTEARADKEYTSARTEALLRAAKNNYLDIEEAPVVKRKRSPKRSQVTALSHLSKAAKNASAAEVALREMPDRKREAFVNGNLESLQNTLEKMRADLAAFEAMVSGTPEQIEPQGLNDHADILSGTPQDADSEEVGVRVNKEYRRTATSNREKAWRSMEVENHEPENKSREAIAAWDDFSAPFKQPAVRRTEIAIQVDPDPPNEPTIEYDPQALADEIAERAAIMEFDGNLSRNEAEDLAFEGDWTRETGKFGQVRTEKRV